MNAMRWGDALPHDVARAGPALHHPQVASVLALGVHDRPAAAARRYNRAAARSGPLRRKARGDSPVSREKKRVKYAGSWKPSA